MAWLLELKSQKSSLSQSAYYLDFMKDKIFNPILNSYLNWRQDLAYRLSLRENNFWWTYDLRSLIFSQKYFVNLSLFQNAFSKHYLLFSFFMDFVGAIRWKPTGDNTPPLGETLRFNGLLHTLSAIALPAKVV